MDRDEQRQQLQRGVAEAAENVRGSIRRTVLRQMQQAEQTIEAALADSSLAPAHLVDRVASTIAHLNVKVHLDILIRELLLHEYCVARLEALERETPDQRVSGSVKGE